MGALVATLCSTSSDVIYWPVRVFLGFSRMCIFSGENRISPTCLGEEMLNFSPAASYTRCSYWFMRSVKMREVSLRASVSRHTPLISMSASTGTSGISISSNSRSPPTSLSRGSKTFFSFSVTSASSAAYS